MADEHDVVLLCDQTSDPDRRVVVGRQRIGLLNIHIEQPTPGLRRLTSPRPARMQYAGRPDAELANGSSSHSLNVVDTACGKRPFRVVVLCLGLPMLNEIQLHPITVRAQTRRPRRSTLTRARPGSGAVPSGDSARNVARLGFTLAYCPAVLTKMARYRSAADGRVSTTVGAIARAG